jgi:DNA replication protein DnaC
METATIDKMRRMNLQGMSSLYEEGIKTGSIDKYTVAEYLGILADAEWEHRENKKIKNLKYKAKFRENAHSLNIDYTISRGLEKGVMERILELNFIKKAENIIITGSTGTGKSYLAQAIGTKACEMLIKSVYYTMSQFTDTVQLMKVQGNYTRWLKNIQGAPLLVLDDFGLSTIDQPSRKALMDIVDFKYGKTSIIIASQIPISEWHALIGEDTIADAIMDRIVYSSHKIELKGESVRKRRKVAS